MRYSISIDLNKNIISITQFSNKHSQISLKQTCLKLITVKTNCICDPYPIVFTNNAIEIKQINFIGPFKVILMRFHCKC